MKKIINKLISKKLIYVITASMAVIGITFMAIKMYPKVQLAEQIDYNSRMSKVQVKLAEAQPERDLTKITSRGSLETRTSTQEKKKDTKAEKKESKNKKDTTKYVSIKDVKISRNMNLTVRTGLSRKDFIKLVAGVRQDTSGFFEENAGTIYDLCKKYNINEIFFCGLISAESGWNIASNHRRTHNYISLMSKGKLIRYGSVYEGLEVAAQKLHNNYLTPGGRFYHGKTLSAVKTNFCPASSTWVDLVYGRMKQML